MKHNIEVIEVVFHKDSVGLNVVLGGGVCIYSDGEGDVFRKKTRDDVAAL
jgi:hypothetical protein